MFPRTQAHSQSLTANHYSSPPPASDAIGRSSSAAVLSRNVKWTRQEVFWKGWLYFSKTALSSETEFGDGVADEHQSYLVGSPLFGLYAKLAIRRGALSLFALSLELPRVIDERADPMLYGNVIFGIPRRADQVPLWLRKHNIAPNTQLISASGNQESLLGVRKDTPERYM